VTPERHWLDLFLDNVDSIFRKEVHRKRLDLAGRKLTGVGETLEDVVTELKKWPAYAQPTVRWATNADFAHDRRPFDWVPEVKHTFVVLPTGQSLPWLLMGRLLGSSLEGVAFGGALAEARGYTTMGDIALASLALLTAPGSNQFTAKIHTEIMGVVEEAAQRMREQDWKHVVEAEADPVALMTFFQKEFSKKGTKGKAALLDVFAFLPKGTPIETFVTTGAIGVVGGRAGGLVKSVPFDLTLNQNFRTRFQFARLMGGRAFRHVNVDPREPRLTHNDREISQRMVASAPTRPVEVFVIKNEDPQGGRRGYSCGEVIPYASRLAIEGDKTGAVLLAIDAAQRLIQGAIESEPESLIINHPPGFPYGFAIYYQVAKVSLDDNFITTVYKHEIIVPVERQLPHHILSAAHQILTSAGLQVGFYCG
jgi:hypothetical protein